MKAKFFVFRTDKYMETAVTEWITELGIAHSVLRPSKSLYQLSFPRYTLEESWAGFIASPDIMIIQINQGMLSIQSANSKKTEMTILTPGDYGIFFYQERESLDDTIILYPHKIRSGAEGATVCRWRLSKTDHLTGLMKSSIQ